MYIAILLSTLACVSAIPILPPPPAVVIANNSITFTPVNGSCDTPDTFSVALGTCQTVSEPPYTISDPIAACGFQQGSSENFSAPVIFTCTDTTGASSSAEYVLHLDILAFRSNVPPADIPSYQSPSPAPSAVGGGGVSAPLVAGVAVAGAVFAVIILGAVTLVKKRQVDITPV